MNNNESKKEGVKMAAQNIQHYNTYLHEMRTHSDMSNSSKGDIIQKHQHLIDYLAKDKNLLIQEICQSIQEEIAHLRKLMTELNVPSENIDKFITSVNKSPVIVVDDFGRQREREIKRANERNRINEFKRHTEELDQVNKELEINKLKEELSDSEK